MKKIVFFQVLISLALNQNICAVRRTTVVPSTVVLYESHQQKEQRQNKKKAEELREFQQAEKMRPVSNACQNYLKEKENGASPETLGRRWNELLIAYINILVLPEHSE